MADTLPNLRVSGARLARLRGTRTPEDVADAAYRVCRELGPVSKGMRRVLHGLPEVIGRTEGTTSSGRWVEWPAARAIAAALDCPIHTLSPSNPRESREANLRSLANYLQALQTKGRREQRANERVVRQKRRAKRDALRQTGEVARAAREAAEAQRY